MLFPVLFKEPLQITSLLKTVCIKRCVVVLQEKLRRVNGSMMIKRKTQSTKRPVELDVCFYGTQGQYQQNGKNAVFRVLATQTISQQESMKRKCDDKVMILHISQL